ARSRTSGLKRAALVFMTQSSQELSLHGSRCDSGFNPPLLIFALQIRSHSALKWPVYEFKPKDFLIVSAPVLPRAIQVFSSEISR
ncbi:hypothetical protein, partial [Comamonas sp.]|uniref:hypothetical protein n=1 Tax=Comamonas sp. TaxID=34028 RepID=UPI0025B9ADC4